MTIVGDSSEILRAEASTGAFVVRRRFRRRAGITVMACAAWIGLLVVLSLTVQWLPIHSYAAAIGGPNRPPNWSAEFLGTDIAGRSMVSRILYGARTSLMISTIATASSAVVGGLVGLSAAYFQGAIATLGEVFSNTILSVPSLLLLLVVVISAGSTIPVIIIACGLVFVPQFLRIARASASTELTRDYIVSARGMGAGWVRIIFRELVPNTWPSRDAPLSDVRITSVLSHSPSSSNAWRIRPTLSSIVPTMAA